MSRKLEGRVAVVTGAASGIGKGIAIAFASGLTIETWSKKRIVSGVSAISM